MGYRRVVFYRAREGKSPVEDFMDSLPGKEAQKVTWVLEAEYLLRMGRKP